MRHTNYSFVPFISCNVIVDASDVCAFEPAKAMGGLWASIGAVCRYVRARHTAAIRSPRIVDVCVSERRACLKVSFLHSLGFGNSDEMVGRTYVRHRSEANKNNGTSTINAFSSSTTKYLLTTIALSRRHRRRT